MIYLSVSVSIMGQGNGWQLHERLLKSIDLFCDEPTGALDEETGKTVLEVLQRINEEFQTTIF